MPETEKLDFMKALKKCEEYITHPDRDIKEKKLLNSSFPPRYLFDIYAVTNPKMPKFFNDSFYYNTDFNIHFKVTTCEMIEMIREYNRFYPLYPYQIMKGSSKDKEFKKDFDNLKDNHKSGLGKPEMEIFIQSIKMNNQDEHYFKVSQREEKKNAKLTVKDYESQRSKGFVYYHEFLNNSFLKQYNVSDTFGNMSYDKKEADIVFIHHDGITNETKKILDTFIQHYMLNEYSYLVLNSSNVESVKVVLGMVMPKVTVLLGSDACKDLGAEHTGIVNRSGQSETIDGTEYTISVSLSYLIKNPTEEAYKILGDVFQSIRDKLVPRESYHAQGKTGPGSLLKDGEIYAYDKLPKKFYEPEWIMLDTVKDGFKSVVHTFRNADTNEKIVRKVPASEFDYYYIAKDPTSISKPSIKVSDTYCKKGPWKFSPDKQVIERYNNTIIYEGNVSIDDKAMTDYYTVTKPEKDYLPQVFRYDIEHDISDFHGTDVSAPYKVTYISAEYNGEYYMWILESDKVDFRESTYEAYDDGLPDKKTKRVTSHPKTRKLHIFEFAGNESYLIEHFWYTLIKHCDPDIMTGWNNLAFDFPYMINRSSRLPYYYDENDECTGFMGCGKIIDMLEMMGVKYTCPSEDDRWAVASLTGIIVSDLQLLYEAQHQNALESYALTFISELELGLSKKPFPAADASRDEWIVYNLWDTELMELIDFKVQATNFRFFLSKIARGSWNKVGENAGIVLSLFLYEAKKNGNVLRTSKLASISSKKYIDSLPGGFTQTNKGGLYEMLVDYDGKSMYPSLMRTFNIGPNTLRYTIPPIDAHAIMTDNGYDPNKEVDVYEAELYFKDGFELPPVKMTLKQIHDMVKERNYMITPAGAIFCSIDEEKSISFDILNTLCNERDYVKSHMNDTGKLDIAMYNKQLALKIAANAFFGVYGFDTFIFYNTTMATSITTTGRMLIKCIMHAIENRYQKNGRTLLESARTVDVFKARDLNFQYTIYADTDGCVIQFGDILKKLGITKPEDKLAWTENELVHLNKYIKDVVDEIYTYFNKGENHRYMYFKEDFYANKGLFYPDKHKYYAIHLIREGGKDKDEVMYRGIAVRKSTYPKITKDRLIELLDMVLGKEDVKLDILLDRISQIENEFYELCQNGSMALGTPTKLGNDFENYKGRPQNVDAMSLWNALNKRKDFKALSKGYLFNITSIDFDHPDLANLTEPEIEAIKKNHKMTSICIPLGVEKLPGYINVDIKSTINKTWAVPYTNILGPVIETTSSSDTNVIDWL